MFQLFYPVICKLSTMKNSPEFLFLALSNNDLFEFIRQLTSIDPDIIMGVADSFYKTYCDFGDFSRIFGILKEIHNAKNGKQFLMHIIKYAL